MPPSAHWEKMEALLALALRLPHTGHVPKLNAHRKGW
jgi:hypothetical protein